MCLGGGPPARRTLRHALIRRGVGELTPHGPKSELLAGLFVMFIHVARCAFAESPIAARLVLRLAMAGALWFESRTLSGVFPRRRRRTNPLLICAPARGCSIRE